MNGELMNLFQLTLAARQSLRTEKVTLPPSDSTLVEGYDFQFAQRGEKDALPAVRTERVADWLELLRTRGARDLKLIVEDQIADYEALRGLNGLPCCLICFYDDGATVWQKRWLYNVVSKRCHVHMEEFVIPQPPQEKPMFRDVSQDMVMLLERLRALAQKLELSRFAFAFRAAQNKLQANFVPADGMMSPAHRRLLAAATEAYVFDGEVPWTEEGKAAAEQKGLLEEYQLLTEELYRGIALSYMYAANEW